MKYPVFIQTSKIHGADLTSSYEEQKATLLLTINWVRVTCPTESITMCSDSSSLLKANPSATGQQERHHHPQLCPRTLRHTRQLGRWQTRESRCRRHHHHHRHVTTSHLIFHQKSPQQTHHYRFPTQQPWYANISYRFPSPLTIRTHATAQGVRPLSRSKKRP